MTKDEMRTAALEANNEKVDKAFDDVTGWMDDPDNVIVAPFILKRPPRTIALACLVALGKITLEEAKDAK